MSEMRLQDRAGNRLYLNAEERAAFLAEARRRPAQVRTLCEALHFTGCRPSEAIEVTPARIDLSGSTITIRSLKKRADKDGKPRIIFRTVPVPADFLDTLNTAHAIREAQRSPRRKAEPLWPITRERVWQIVRDVMDAAEISDGPHRTCKGLRHGFGVNAIRSGVPLNLLSRWLGHASLETTAIYASAQGREEREIAARMWG
jgi:integrase